jgi:hypothetical protein
METINTSEKPNGKGVTVEYLMRNAISIKINGSADSTPWYVFHYNNGNSYDTPGTTGTGSCLVPFKAVLAKCSAAGARDIENELMAQVTGKLAEWVLE